MLQFLAESMELKGQNIIKRHARLHMPGRNARESGFCCSSLPACLRYWHRVFLHNPSGTVDKAGYKATSCRDGMQYNKPTCQFAHPSKVWKSRNRYICAFKHSALGRSSPRKSCPDVLVIRQIVLQHIQRQKSSVHDALVHFSNKRTYHGHNWCIIFFSTLVYRLVDVQFRAAQCLGARFVGP